MLFKYLAVDSRDIKKNDDAFNSIVFLVHTKNKFGIFKIVHILNMNKNVFFFMKTFAIEAVK